MQYSVVYDINAASSPIWHGLIIFGPLVAVGLLLFAIRRRWPFARPGSNQTPILACVIIVGAVLLILAIATLGSQRRSLLSALREGRGVIVEGLVEQFQPMPANGHGMERLCVHGQCVEYSDFMISAGFHHAYSRGGPIREGLAVRLTYVDRTIVRLEVGRP